MNQNYNILGYEHKEILTKDLNNFKDTYFKRELIKNFKKPSYNKYDLKFFNKHIRSINVCLNKLYTDENKIHLKNSLKNSIKFLFINYNKDFIISLLKNYFKSTVIIEKKEIVDKIIDEINLETENAPIK